MGKYRKPLLTKPAGVFVQLLGLFCLFSGFFTLAINSTVGILVIALGPRSGDRPLGLLETPEK
jgi:hypothetical protein